METTVQVTPPELRNPTGTGGFGDNPQNRNNGGRIKNPLKEFSRSQFEAMTDEEKKEFLAKVSHLDQWKMAEGNPKQDNEHSGPDGGDIPVNINITFHGSEVPG